MVVTNPADVEPYVAQFRTTGNPNPVNDTSLVYGVAGRSDPNDPPFFVYAAVRPTNEAEVNLALDLLFGGAGYKDVIGAGDLTRYQTQKVSGKEVYVGTLDMLSQDVHQRGRPYLYQTAGYMFVVITDDDSWAADAIGSLP